MARPERENDKLSIRRVPVRLPVARGAKLTSKASEAPGARETGSDGTFEVENVEPVVRTPTLLTVVGLVPVFEMTKRTAAVWPATTGGKMTLPPFERAVVTGPAT